MKISSPKKPTLGPAELFVTPKREESHYETPKLGKSLQKETKYDGEKPVKLETTTAKRAETSEEDAMKFYTARKIPHYRFCSDLEDNVNPYRDSRARNINDSITKEDQYIKLVPKASYGYIINEKLLQISEIPLRDKFAHLLPEHQCYNATLYHKSLLIMQAKLDEHLQFLRSNRGKKRGDFFRNIRKSMIDSLKLYIEVAHIRQMLFLDISLYKIVRAKNKESSYDLLIDLPLEADLPRRRDNFKKALYSFVKNQPESNSPVPIPQCKFLFETDAEAEDNCLLNRDSLEKVETGKVEKDKANKLDPLDILTLGNNVKETLYYLIRNKENKLKKRYPSQDNKKEPDKQYLLWVIDEIQKIYVSKGVSNIFEVVLQDILNKKLSCQSDSIAASLQYLSSFAPQYLKRVYHSKGVIYQLNRTLYGETRKAISDNSGGIEHGKQSGN